MKNKVSFLIQKFRGHTYFMILSGFIFVNLYSQFSSREIIKTSVLNEGLHTCFSRLNQSFTSKFLGSKGSPYLSNGFMKTTEECYGDVTYVLENNFKSVGKDTLKKMNNLSSNIHWLHRNLSKNRQELSRLNISSRFQEIEGLNDMLLEEVKIIKEKIESGILWGNFIFYPLTVAIFLIFFFEVYRSRKISLKNRERESEANEEIKREDSLIVGKVENIILSALQNNNLKKCASLFSLYQNQVYEGKVTKFLISSPDDLEKDQDKDNEVEVVENIQSPVFEVSESSEEDISADAILSKVIDIHSSKIFTQGVKLDLNVEDNVYVKAEQESLEQIFYYLILNAVNSSDPENKKVSLKLKKLGGSVIIELNHSGKGFSKELIYDQLGLGKLDEIGLEKKLGIELTIVKTLIKENQGDLSLENLKDSNGNVIGAKVRLVFNGTKKEIQGELVDLKKGKKKEIKEYLDNQI